LVIKTRQRGGYEKKQGVNPSSSAAARLSRYGERHEHCTIKLSSSPCVVVLRPARSPFARSARMLRGNAFIEHSKTGVSADLNRRVLIKTSHNVRSADGMFLVDRTRRNINATMPRYQLMDSRSHRTAVSIRFEHKGSFPKTSISRLQLASASKAKETGEMPVVHVSRCTTNRG